MLNKQELLENYTMEQLADMVVDLKSELSSKENMLKTKYAKCEISEDGDILQVVCDKCGEKFIAFLEDKYLLCTKTKFFGIQDANRQLNKDVERLQTAINQIDDILNELFGVTHDVAKPDEFKKILKDKIENSKTIADFLPTEPIKVADMLINAEGEYEHHLIVKKICGSDKGRYNLFDIQGLRQIAEHLLIYCNANVERE